MAKLTPIPRPRQALQEGIRLRASSPDALRSGARRPEDGVTRLTVSIERDNRLGRRFYEKSGFGEPREHAQQLQGYVLDLIEYRRPIPGARAR